MATLKWGILGAAKVAETRMIPSFNQSGDNPVVAIGSRSLDKAARLAAASKSRPRPYEGYQAVLDDPDVDAVYIALPNALHAEWAIKAARLGKHVLVEKPFAANGDEAERMVEAASATGVVLEEALMHRFHPVIERILALVRGGRIGELKSITTSFSYVLRDPDDIRRDPALAGGSLFDVGTYCVNLARLIAGTEPVEINARGMFGPSGTDELVTGNLWFPNGVVATFLSSFVMPRSNPLMLVGTKGQLYAPWTFSFFNDMTLRIMLHADQTHDAPGETVEHVKHEDPYRLMIEDFAAAVAARRPPRITLEESLTHQRVLDALLSAARGDCV